MRLLHVVHLVALLPLLAAGCASRTKVVVSPDYFAHPPKRIAVLPFAGSLATDKVTFLGIGGWRDLAHAGDMVSDLLTASLMESGLYQIVERGQLKRVIDEQKLMTCDVFAPEDLAKLRELLGVEAIIVGVVSEFNQGFFIPVFWIDNVVASWRMVDVSSGLVLWTVNTRRGRRLMCPPPSAARSAEKQVVHATRLLQERIVKGAAGH